MQRAFPFLSATVIAVLALFPNPRQAAAQVYNPQNGARADYRSLNFLLRTDLSSTEARKLLRRLEQTLKTASDYWGRSPRGKIECYVAKDVAKWPDSALPHPWAKLVIGGVGGGTYVWREPRGDRVRRRATVLACARPGVAEHEAVHAYCHQTFGATGPTWYKEGIAELACYAFAADVQCPQEQIDYLQAHRPPQLEAVFDKVFSNTRLTQPIHDALSRARSSGAGLKSWSRSEKESISAARRRYYWTWALCHLLYHNPNYSASFRRLGRKFVRAEKASFEEHFRQQRKRISFEFNFFLKRMVKGYRVDLCAWDWSEQSHNSLGSNGKSNSNTATVRIAAARGYQLTPLTLVKGGRYSYTTRGGWSSRAEAPMTGGDGDAEGRGRLVGVVMRDFQLSREFELGAEGQFTAIASGRLYLRCRDDWGKLHDNRGELHVRLTGQDR